MNILILSALIFLSVTLAIWGLLVLMVPTKTQKRMQNVFFPAHKGSEAHWAETVVSVVGPFAKLSTPSGDWETSPLRIKLLRAGLRHDDARLVYFGAKTLLPILLAGIAFFFLQIVSQADGLMLIFFLVLAALVGCYLPNVVLYWKVRSRKREIFENFADAADLMLVCVEAGLGLDAGLTKVAEEMKVTSVALAEELHLTNLEMRAGGTREQSLRNLATRTGVEEIGTFAIMLTQADRFGTSIGESLRVFSDDLRHKRQSRAEEMASKVPTKMLFPLVVCVFPSIIMVIMGPAAIQVIRTILPMLNGRL
ncbi:MAG TPA: type II secretion system F family protein [Noviherbaspirillum sp.]|jgi:tight adherence protein C|uniref:type II secretion system F family protein n=1 Tax=Noviherbaspirillum sp. TaxID=1926288 RepID=UPI002DDD4F03|nr:type II secretion system F family protein [Noviherbaspirillum sp.]HEV2610989.1 type II secretion system F family protein [Noviherbaspirillum sp.]